MFTKKFWLQAAERAVKTFAQALAGMLAAAATLEAVDWVVALSGAGLAALLSVLMSLGSLPVGPDGSPSLVEVE